MAKTEFIPDYSTRWYPDFRYRDIKKLEVKLNTFNSKTKSKTDKEAYRLTLASLNGDINSLNGSASNNVGSYSLKAGEEYNPATDFSFLNRLDITVVQLDEYIKKYQENCENYDESLRQQIEQQLVAKREELVQKEKEEGNKE